jgi:hypothetical protein
MFDIYRHKSLSIVVHKNVSGDLFLIKPKQNQSSFMLVMCLTMQHIKLEMCVYLHVYLYVYMRY